MAFYFRKSVLLGRTHLDKQLFRRLIKEQQERVLYTHKKKMSERWGETNDAGNNLNLFSDAILLAADMEYYRLHGRYGDAKAIKVSLEHILIRNYSPDMYDLLSKNVSENILCTTGESASVCFLEVPSPLTALQENRLFQLPKKYEHLVPVKIVDYSPWSVVLINTDPDKKMHDELWNLANKLQK